MTTSTFMGRAAARLERFGSGLCLTLTAYAFLMATEARAAVAQDTSAAPVATTPSAPRVQGDGPALWVVEDADSTTYLFGTVHLLKPGTAWRSDKVDAAFDSASDVCFEVANPDDQTAIMPIIQQYGTSPDRPLSSILNAEEMTRLDAAARTAGGTAAQMDPLRPWFAALMIGMAPLSQAGFDPKSGVELDLRARALLDGKPIRGFETLDQQIGGLARMSEEGQQVYLRYYLAHSDTAATEFERAVEGWRVGDDEAMRRYTFDTGRGISEETHQIFLARRNVDWAG